MNIVDCDSDTDCTYVPYDMLLIKSDYVCEDTSNTDY